MSSLLHGIGDVAEKYTGEAVAFGLGFALARVLEPEGTQLGQASWAKDPSRALEPELAAGIVAEGEKDAAWGEREAAQTGIDAERFNAILTEVLQAPGFGEMVRMLRRGSISIEDFAHGLRKAKLEHRWDTPLEELQHERLDPAVVATAIQRGIIPDPGILPVGPPTETGRVPAFPVAPIDAIAEAGAAGINRDRLAAMVGNVGLPPAPGELLQLLNRDVILEQDFYRGVAEGNTRNEWGHVLIELRRNYPSPSQYAEARLRGWVSDQEMYNGAKIHGYEQAEVDLLFKLHGRPIPVHQVTTGLARGGSYDGPTGDIPAVFIHSLQQGNERPEWYNLSYANRYSLPSAFVLRTLASAGEVSPEETHTLLLQIGWPPELAEKVTRVWTAGSSTVVDKHVGKAQTQLWTTLHKSYVDAETDAAKAGPALIAAGVPESSHEAILATWDHEREIVRRGLTPAQIKKALGETKFTEQQATERLLELGYSTEDAATFLAE